MGIKIALIPWDKDIQKDNIYKEKENGSLNWHILFCRAFQQRNVEFHTIDVYDDLCEVDFFLFFALEYAWLNKVISAGLANKMIYCSGEPEVVKPINSKKGYEKLKKLFPYILTWNPELIDQKRIFIRNIPYYFEINRKGLPFNERKLMTNISGNKSSKIVNELYSEREKVITFFEKKHPEDFDLYGTGWKRGRHPSYLGMADYKSDVYHRYKFALCLENTWDVNGYITEKILDCLCYGIVPVYWGAKNILDYIPANCFIDYTKFGELESLYRFLSKMDEKTYQTYLDAADQWLKGESIKKFSSEVFCQNIMDVIEQGEKVNIQVSFFEKIVLKFYEYVEQWNNKAIIIRKNMKKRFMMLMGR